MNKLENLFTQTVSMGIRVTVMLLAVPVVMVALHWQLALVSPGVVPVLAGLTKLFESRASPTFAIAHRLSTVRDADTIPVFDEGEFVERAHVATVE